MVAFAKPWFDGGPTDLSTKVVDVYTAVDSNVRNALNSKVSSFNAAMDQVLSGSSTSLDSILGNIRKSLDQPYDINSMLMRVNRAMAGSQRDLMNLGTSVQNGIYTALTGKQLGTNYLGQAMRSANDVQMVINDTKSVFRGNYLDVSSVVGVVNEIAGSRVATFLDLGAQAAVAAEVMNKAAAWGIPDLMTSVLRDNYNFNRSVVQQSARAIVVSANIDSILAMVDKVGASAITSEVPNAVQMVLQNYSLPTGTTVDKYPALITKIVGLFNALQPDWFFRKFGSLNAFNLVTLESASEDSITLFTSDPTYRDAFLITDSYTTKDLLSVAITQYPLGSFKAMAI